MRANLPAIGTAVFLIGFGSALLAGIQAHNLTHEGGMLYRELGAYQVLTVIGLIIASIGIGIVTYGLVFENHENDARKIPMFAIVIGAVISALGFGTAIWAALWIEHMGDLWNVYISYDALQSWSFIGFWVGSLGMVVMIYGLTSDSGHHLRKR